MSARFDRWCGEAVKAGRRAADLALEQWLAKESPEPALLKDWEPEAVGYTDTEILLEVTGEKHLDDWETEDTLTSTFRDAFYEAVEELNDR